MADRSSRPRHCPNLTAAPVRRAILELRWRHRLGPMQIGGRLGVATSTVHAVLVRAGVSRLSRIDRVTGEPIRRYEHPHPGAMLHVDVTKFGNVSRRRWPPIPGPQSGHPEQLRDGSSGRRLHRDQAPQHRLRIPAHRDR